MKTPSTYDISSRGNTALARHYLNERLTAKPASGLGWRLQAGL